MKYKVGQKVKIIKNEGSEVYDRFLNTIATIVKIER